MKQTVFMAVATLAGTGGVLFLGPMPGVAVYYLFAVLRPQYLWEWALPADIPWSQFVAIAAVIGTIGLLLGVLPGGGPDKPWRGLSKVTIACLAFGAWVSATYFTALDQSTAWPWLIEYLKIFTMFIVGAMVIRTVAHVWTLYLVATLALIYIAYEVNILYFLQGRLDIYHRGYGGLDNNGAALTLAMAVPLALYAWEAIRRWWRWAFALAIPVVLHAVLMTYSRGAMLALLICTPLLLWRSRKRLQLGLVAVCLAALIPAMAGEEIRARFFTLQAYDSDASAQSRFGSWQAALAIAHDYPIFGVGIRNANLLSHYYGADLEGRTIHSQYLQFLADSGYPALGLYIVTLAMFAGSVRQTRRRLRRVEGHDVSLALSMTSGLEGAMAVFCVGAFFLSLEVFELPYLIILLGGQLAVVTRGFAMPDPLTVTGKSCVGSTP